jgi:UDP-N-acetylmuramyl pentapeptide phosphotransferase/UDP-N-acetylglucosamine-1-phosphate transferase
MLFKLILVFTTAFVLGLSLYPVFIKLYTKNDIVDRRETRKVHLNEVPTMGGVPIFLAFLISIFIWLSFTELQHQRFIIGTLIFIFFLGLRDDFISLKPITKLISQLVPAVVIFYLTDIKLYSLYGFISEAHFPLLLSFGITIFTIIVITNSFNLIDGLDGLAATISIIVLSTLGIWLVLVEEPALGILSIAMSGSVFAFIQFNWQPAKIFMGDTGALLLGFLMAVFTIMFININHSLGDEHIFRFKGSIATALGILIIPLFDTLRSFTSRIIKRKSPFTADKNHTHHALLRLGFSHAQVVVLLGSINIIFIALAIVFRHIGDNVLIPAIIFLGINLNLLLEYLILKQLLSEKKEGPISIMEVIKSSKKAS